LEEQQIYNYLYHIQHLNALNRNYDILVIEQTKGHYFNKGAIFNAGVNIGIKMGCDYFALHDVDVLPFTIGNDYPYPKVKPIHCAPAQSKYNFNSVYKTYIGGCILITPDQYLIINGFSNMYWGWGLEDYDVALRIRRQYKFWETVPVYNLMININHPQVMNLDKTEIFKKSQAYWAITKRDRNMQSRDGFNTVRYRIKENIVDTNYKHFLVELTLPEMPQLGSQNMVWVKNQGYQPKPEQKNRGWVIEINTAKEWYIRNL